MSKRSHNAEGVPEKELRRRARQDKAICCRFKKRHRKDLSSDEVAELLLATQKPYRLQKDIAKQFHVPAILVSRLVKEA